MAVRLMEDRDLNAAAWLEQISFSQPWSFSLLKEGLLGGLDTYFVVEEGLGVTGYCCLRIIAGEGEIQRLAVDPQARRAGMGKKLMEAMVDFAIDQGVKDITLEVRESNIPARNLYRTYGFKEEAVRKGYYQSPEEDAIIMWKHLI